MANEIRNGARNTNTVTCSTTSRTTLFFHPTGFISVHYSLQNGVFTAKFGCVANSAIGTRVIRNVLINRLYLRAFQRFGSATKPPENHICNTSVARLLEIKPTGKKCVGMEGIIQEGAEVLEEEGEDAILDLGLIGAGSRVEHYEMAGYLTAISLAKRLNANEAAMLLQQSLSEEEAAEQKLRTVASKLMKSSATAA